MDLNEMRKRYYASKEENKTKNISNTQENSNQNSNIESPIIIEDKEYTENSLFFCLKNYDNGDWYEGQFTPEGLYHGKGTYYFKDGDKLEGYWHNGDIIKGIEYLSDGERYEGEFNEDWNYNGQGTLFFTDGDKLEAHWKDGDPIKGIWHSSDGERYEGEFNENWNYNGRGTCYYKDGRKLEAHWKDGNPIKGIWHSSDGEQRYEGEFNENWNYNGRGTYYYKDGRKLEGFWKNGEYISTSHSNNKTSLRKSVFIEACDKAINFLVGFERICYQEKKKSLAFVENIPIPYAYEAEWNQILKIWRTYVNFNSINTKTLSNPDNVVYNHRPYPITSSIGIQELIKEIRDKA